MNTVLIAEDEPSIAGLIKLCLSQSGYSCTVAEDGAKAADLIESRPFDIALLDIMLPEYDGYTLLEYSLLEQLMRSRGVALYRDVLYMRVWGGEAEDDTRTLDLHIKRLRKKLGWDDKIVTIYKVGYMLKTEDMP